MTIHQKLKNAPIVEAVFDLRFNSDNDITIELLKKISSSLISRFPIITDFYSWSFKAKIEGSTQDASQTKVEPIGYRLINEEKSFILGITKEGLTFSKLKPYNSWEEIEDEAKYILKEIVEHLKDINVTRLGLRYLNQFDIKFENNLVNDYLKILPSYPANLPNIVDSFAIILQIPKEDLHSTIRFEMQEIPNTNETQRITIDIDISKNDENYKLSSFDVIFAEFTKMKNYKNEIFFSSISQKTLATFN